MLYNGRLYVGKYTASAQAGAMLAALGVKVTPTVLAKLLPFCGSKGKVLYTSAVGEAAEETVTALKAQAQALAAVRSFVAAPASTAAFSAWQALQNGECAAEQAQLAAAEEAARAIEKQHGLPAGSVKLPSAAKAGKANIAAAEAAKVLYFTLVVGQYKQHLKAECKNAAVQEYALAHFSATASSESAGIESASIALPSRRKASSSNGGNGTKPSTLIPSNVAGVAWAGSWSATASQLLAAGAVEECNFTRHPALQRAASALKQKNFTFAHGTFKGSYVLENIEEFKVYPPSASEAEAS